jgi:hypothetical protein
MSPWSHFHAPPTGARGGHPSAPCAGGCASASGIAMAFLARLEESRQYVSCPRRAASAAPGAAAKGTRPQGAALEEAALEEAAPRGGRPLRSAWRGRGALPAATPPERPGGGRRSAQGARRIRGRPLCHAGTAGRRRARVGGERRRAGVAGARRDAMTSRGASRAKRERGAGGARAGQHRCGRAIWCSIVLAVAECLHPGRHP